MPMLKEIPYTAAIHPACIILWPDDDMCWGDELHEYDWKSDDYLIIYPYAARYAELANLLNE